MTTPNDHAGDLVCRLVTRGRVTGRRHDIEMWFGVRDDVLYFISGNGPGADWYRNALAAGTVEVRLGSTWGTGAARDVDDPGERVIVGEVMGAKYGGWGGDPEIGLTEHDWLWRVPVLAVDGWPSR